MTLELALAGVPMVGAYKVSRLEEPLKYFVKIAPLDPAAEPDPRRARDPRNSCSANARRRISRAALAEVVREGAPRQAQLAALARLDERMRLPDGEAPSARAARLVLRTIAGRAAATGAEAQASDDQAAASRPAAPRR